MTYNALEVSNNDGQPIGFYKFNVGSKAWFYTSADRDIDFDGDTYLAVAITDDGVKQGGGTASGDDLTISAQADLELLQLYIGTPPSTAVAVTVRRQHYGDSEAPIQWVGTIGSVKRTNLAASDIICKTQMPGGQKRAGPRLCWERACPHVIYDNGCKLNPADWGVAGVVTVLTPTVLNVDTVSDHPAGWFDGGYIEWEFFPGVLERRGLVGHVGSNGLKILGLTDGLALAQEVTLYPGDDRTAQTCNDKFSNIDNYGGIRHLPGKSPFDGNPIF